MEKPEIKTEDIENRNNAQAPATQETPVTPHLTIHDPAEDNLCDSCQ